MPLSAKVIAVLLVLLLVTACSSGKGPPKDSTLRSTSLQPGPATPPAEVTSAAKVAVHHDEVITVSYSSPFVWPANGPITSVMGPDHPDGIDIGLGGSESRVIRAAAQGTVVFAGGGNDQPLGLSIIIDHGNGVTTTYGHLAELDVSKGDEVTLGQRIGIGGETGIATGIHLHFEVRKDGKTVDPLGVLPAGGPYNHLLGVDCATSRIVLPSGSQATVDYSRSLGVGDRIISVSALPSKSVASLHDSVEGDAIVTISTPIDLNSNREDDYTLKATVDNSSGNYTFDCPLVIQHRSVPTRFYVKANLSPTGPAPRDVTPEPTPTPTPNPRQPKFEIPSYSGVDAQTPKFESPTGSIPNQHSPDYSTTSTPSP